MKNIQASADLHIQGRDLGLMWSGDTLLVPEPVYALLSDKRVRDPDHFFSLVTSFPSEFAQLGIAQDELREMVRLAAEVFRQNLDPALMAAFDNPGPRYGMGARLPRDFSSE